MGESAFHGKEDYLIPKLIKKVKGGDVFLPGSKIGISFL